MTEILFGLKADSLKGLEGISGVLRAKPTQLRFEGAAAVVPRSVPASIIDGDLLEPFIIPPSDVTMFLWTVTLSVRSTGQVWSWTFDVPDIDSIQLEELIRLHQVDPTTGLPDPGTAAGDLFLAAVTRMRADAIEAAASATEAQTVVVGAISTATGAASTATGAASTATGAAADAGTARTGAETARDAAQQARQDAIAAAASVPTSTQLAVTFAPRDAARLSAEFDKIRRSRFGKIGTAGKAAVAFRIDHQLDPFIATFLPLFLARRIPFSIGLVTRSVGNPTATYEPTTATWADVHSKILPAGGEVWAHSRTHSDPLPGQTLYDEIAGSRLDIEAQAIGVRGFQSPGGPATWGTFIALSDYGSPAGRIIRENFPLYESDVRGTTRRMLPASGSFGDAHATIDQMSLATAKQWVDEAVLYGHGLEYMFHPKWIGDPGNISVADVTALLDYIVTLRDAGKIEVLSASGLAFADPTSTYRRNVVPYGSFEGVTTASPPAQWAAFSGAAWTIQTDGGRTGSNYLRVPNTAGAAVCLLPVPDFSMAGAPYEFRGWVRGTETGGTLGRTRITVRTPRGNPIIRDVQTTVAQSTAWTFVRFPFTLPSDVTDILLAVGRFGGGSADWDDVEIVAI